MFGLFKKKKTEEQQPVAQEKLELLYKENIKVGCKSDTQENVIKTLGKMLVDKGYVNQNYIAGMLEREKSFSTFMGNELALPHGVEAVKKEVKASGIAIMTFEEPVLWGEENIKIAVAIAGVGEEHIDILSLICEKMMDEETAKQLLTGDVETVYNILARKG